MKIIIIGATGTIGRAITENLATRHDIIRVGKSSGDYQVDITNEQDIIKLFEKIGPFDALLSATGQTKLLALQYFKQADWEVGLNNKLMGQVNLVTHGLKSINEGGSFTLMTGSLNHEPIKFGASAAMINGALEGFVKSASLEMPSNIRINAVSPTVLAESMNHYEEYFRGYTPTSAKSVAKAYEKSVEGLQTGQIYRVGW